MQGTALVTIGENQWNVEVASTPAELIAGLSGRTSLPAGTGMLFVLPVRQAITVQTNEMLFPLDIIFIKDNLVLDVVQNVEPGNLVEEATPCDGFIEVNAGEATLVGVGDTVDVGLYTYSEITCPGCGTRLRLTYPPSGEPAPITNYCPVCDAIIDGGAINAEVVPTQGFDISSIMAFAIPLIILGFVSGMIGGGSYKKDNS